MNVLGRAALRWMPEVVRKPVLDVLFARTAVAFGLPTPRVRGLSSTATLQAFADFSARAATDAAASRLGDLGALDARLVEAGYRPGRWLRRVLGVSSRADCMAVARSVYRLLDIDFRGDARGDITISRCSFSRSYSSDVCRVMSALDAGLLAGLSGGERLVFSERITDGHPCCRARLLAMETGA